MMETVIKREVEKCREEGVEQFEERIRDLEGEVLSTSVSLCTLIVAIAETSQIILLVATNAKHEFKSRLARHGHCAVRLALIEGLATLDFRAGLGPKTTRIYLRWC